VFAYANIGVLQVKLLVVHPVGIVLFCVDRRMDGWLDMTWWTVAFHDFSVNVLTKGPVQPSRISHTNWNKNNVQDSQIAEYIIYQNIPHMLYSYLISPCTTWGWPTSVAETCSCA